MKHQETLLNIPIKNNFTELSVEEIGDDHLYTGVETPMVPDAFLISNEEKKERIAGLFKEIMETMGLDLSDDSLKGTPKRVAKMYIEEIFSGLFWVGNKAIELGLADGVGSINQILENKFGKKVKIKMINQKKSFLQRRFSSSIFNSEEILSKIEEKVMLSRFGL